MPSKTVPSAPSTSILTNAGYRQISCCHEISTATVFTESWVAAGLFRCQTMLAVARFSASRMTASPSLSEAATSINRIFRNPFSSMFLSEQFDISRDGFKSNDAATRSDPFCQREGNVTQVCTDVVHRIAGGNVLSDCRLEMRLGRAQQVCEVFVR